MRKTIFNPTILIVPCLILCDRAGRNSVLAGGSIEEPETPLAGGPPSKRELKIGCQHLSNGPVGASQEGKSIRLHRTQSTHGIIGSRSHRMSRLKETG